MTWSSLPFMGIQAGRYRYLDTLLRLGSMLPSTPPLSWPCCVTPLRVEMLAPLMTYHPDQQFVQYILQGLIKGFRIGYDRSGSSLRPLRHNHPSSLANPHTVSMHVDRELQAGRLVGPIQASLAIFVHTSPIGLVPKSHSSNRWRVIVDLSAPRHQSVNDGISPQYSIRIH